MPTLAPVSRLSLKNILFPTDFSAASCAALPFAQSLARMYGSTILFVHSIRPESHSPIVTDRVPELDDFVSREAQAKLEAFVRNAALVDVPAKTFVDRGDVAVTIPAIIREQHVDLVVLGTHGRHGVGVRRSLFRRERRRHIAG